MKTTLFLSLFLLGSLLTASAQINKTWTGVAIKGYDPVAYFTDGAPAKGQKAFQTKWKGATWRFKSEANRNAFLAAPDRYAPQYGGYCAWAMADGEKAGIDPNQWDISGGKLYLNYNADIKAKWAADKAGMIIRADAEWATASKPAKPAKPFKR